MYFLYETFHYYFSINLIKYKLLSNTLSCYVGNNSPILYHTISNIETHSCKTVAQCESKSVPGFRALSDRMIALPAGNVIGNKLILCVLEQYEPQDLQAYQCRHTQYTTEAIRSCFFLFQLFFQYGFLSYYVSKIDILGNRHAWTIASFNDFGYC